MTSKTLEIDASTLGLDLTVRVTGLKALGLRARLAGWLFKLGGWVAGPLVRVALDEPEASRAEKIGLNDVVVVMPGEGQCWSSEVAMRIGEGFNERGFKPEQIMIFPQRVSLDVLRRHGV